MVDLHAFLSAVECEHNFLICGLSGALQLTIGFIWQLIGTKMQTRLEYSLTAS